MTFILPVQYNFGVMTFTDVCARPVIPNSSLVQTREQVVKILLEHSSKNANGRPLSQRNIADMAGMDWDTVHASLKSLQDEGAIRIERQRLVINIDLVKKITGRKERVSAK